LQVEERAASSGRQDKAGDSVAQLFAGRPRPLERQPACHCSQHAIEHELYGGLETDTFTSHVLPALIPVAAKQTIDVTVVISFS
jgi:hypothetical protein